MSQPAQQRLASRRPGDTAPAHHTPAALPCHARPQIWRHQLTHTWRYSHYHLKDEDETAGASKRRRADFVEDYKQVGAQWAGVLLRVAVAGGFSATCTCMRCKISSIPPCLLRQR